ncbi:hypothetical protein ACGFNU_44115 [Spirillospora sp. NPDC048911]|uniref:hypothetical protein n=1 Tax=Spirillospora sp. NPDC048911 TaxID=3364527 RepID=UPI003710F866
MRLQALVARPRGRHTLVHCASQADAPTSIPAPVVVELVVMGAHGGAGTTTLARLLGPSWDMGSITRRQPDRAPFVTRGRPLVLACRNTPAAARAATAAIAALRHGGQEVAVLVVVGDGGPEPRDATARFALLADRTGGLVRMPFVTSLRLVDDPVSVRLPAKAQAALAAVHDLTRGQLRP